MDNSSRLSRENKQRNNQQITERIRKSEKSYDLVKIRAAYDLAEAAHAGQMRSSGDPYITHPLSVADILLDYCMDTDTICAALLHDTVEDTDVTLEELRDRALRVIGTPDPLPFGDKVVGVVLNRHGQVQDVIRNIVD